MLEATTRPAMCAEHGCDQADYEWQWCSGCENIEQGSWRLRTDVLGCGVGYGLGLFEDVEQKVVGLSLWYQWSSDGEGTALVCLVIEHRENISSGE